MNERKEALKAQMEILESLRKQYIEANIYGPAHVMLCAKLEAVKNELRIF